jgi:hypothetical protein
LGGAIFMRSGALQLLDCDFLTNGTTGGAGGISFGGAGQGKGGAIYLMPGVFAVQSGSLFTGNTATDDNATPGDDDDVFGTFH